MDINFILHGINFRESYEPLEENIIGSFQNLDQKTKFKIDHMLKVLRWTSQDADEFYQMEYDEEITPDNLNHFILFLQSNINGESPPPKYKKEEFNIDIPQLMSQTGDINIRFSDKDWNDIKKTIPSNILATGFTQNKKVILTSNFIKEYHKMGITDKDYQRINQAIATVLPYLLANKSDGKLVYDLHLWGDQDSLKGFGFRPIGGSGMQVNAVGNRSADNSTFILKRIGTGHDLADVNK